MGEFFHMGGYAAFVWPAYIASALGVGGLAFMIWRRGRALSRRLKALEEAQTRLDAVRPAAAAPDEPPAP